MIPNSGLTCMKVYEVFVHLPPLELMGMELLREQPHYIGGFAQVPRAELVEAVTEIVAYTGRCTTAARSLAHLKPIPLLSASVWEFGV
jgi:hypothetical protein